MIVSCMVAMARNYVIGKDNTLPWRLPADMKRFRSTTMGKTVLMGRATYESMGKPLEGRNNVVVSSRTGFAPAGVVVVATIDEAFAAAARYGVETVVIGGGQVYAATMHRIELLYLTVVDVAIEGDVYFPKLERADWDQLAHERREADAKNAHAMDFFDLRRRSVPRHDSASSTAWDRLSLG